MPNKPHPTPKDLTSSWPAVPSEDPAGEAARLFVVNLLDAMDGRSIRSVAADAGVDEASVRRILAGTAWPHLRALILLEQSLGVRLYPK